MRKFIPKAKKTVIILFSAFVYAVAMNAFVESGNLFPGGFSGISRLITMSLEKYAGVTVSFGVIYFSLNLLSTLIVFRVIGKWFTIYSVLWFSAASFFTGILPKMPVTEDPLLICVFGGLLGGLGLSLSLRQDASSGGFDFIAIYASERFNMSTWNYILAINVVVLVIAGSIFGWNQALYSIIYQYCSTQVVSALHDRYKTKNLMMITQFPEEVSQNLFHTCRHGITRIDCIGEFSHSERSMLFMVINGNQVHDVIEAARSADPKIFIDLYSSERVVGNYYRKPLE